MNGTIIFLQNAWSPLYAGREWPRKSWLRALEKSRSGQRLGILVGVDWDCCENITPQVGKIPSSVMREDEPYVLSILERRKPKVVIACGRHAERTLKKLWPGPLLVVPHPAHRLLTNLCYRLANDLILKDGFNERVALRLNRNGTVREEPI